MNDNPLIFIIGGALFLFLGVSALRDGEVYLGRLIRFIGPKLVLRSRPAVLIWGVGFSIAGAASLVSALGIILSPQSGLVDQIMPIALYGLIGGFAVSVVVELVFYASNLGPYADVDPQDVADRYPGSYR